MKLRPAVWGGWFGLRPLLEIAGQRAGGRCNYVIVQVAWLPVASDMSADVLHQSAVSGSKLFVVRLSPECCHLFHLLLHHSPASLKGPTPDLPRPNPGSEARDPPTRFVGTAPAFGELWVHGFRSLAAGVFQKGKFESDSRF